MELPLSEIESRPAREHHGAHILIRIFYSHDLRKQNVWATKSVFDVNTRTGFDHREKSLPSEVQPKIDTA